MALLVKNVWKIVICQNPFLAILRLKRKEKKGRATKK